MASSKEYIQKSSSDAVGSELVSGTICIPCHLDNETKPAYGYCIDCKEHLCDICHKVHKKQAPSRHHRLQEQVTMPTVQRLPNQSTSTDTRPDDSLTTLCTQHITKIQDRYCKDHNLVLCSICVVLNHTTCTVNFIPDISQEILGSPSLHDSVESMDKLKSKFDSIKTQLQEDTKRSTKSLKQALSDLKNYRQDINRRIDELEKELEDKILTLKQHYIDLEETRQAMCQEIRETSNTLKDNIKHMSTCQLANTLFTEIKQAQNRLLEYDESIRNIMSQVSSLDQYKFEPGPEIYNALYTNNKLDDIKRACQVMTKPTSQGNVDICIQTNICFPSFINMTVVSPDKLVVIYSNNVYYIQLVDLTKKTVISKIQIPNVNHASTMTSTSIEQVAVTVPEDQCIQLVSVTDKLNQDCEIKTNGKCYGISYHSDKLLVTYNNPSKLEILDKKGNVIKAIDKYTSGEDIFSTPKYVEASYRYIYVSDIESKEIIMLNWNGYVITRCKDFKQPRGLAMLDDGCLLVGDCGGKVIYKVSRDCKHKQVFLSNVENPGSFCVDKQQHKLCTNLASCKVEVWNI